MNGTNRTNPRCAALLGDIGATVRCTIYDGRPTPCREFGVDWVDGHLQYVEEDLDRCTRARAAFGLPQLLDHPLHTGSTDEHPPIPLAS